MGIRVSDPENVKFRGLGGYFGVPPLNPEIPRNPVFRGLGGYFVKFDQNPEIDPKQGSWDPYDPTRDRGVPPPIPV